MKKSAPCFMILFAVLGIAIAFYDSYAIYTHQPLWCPPPIDGCNTVANSPYARIFAIPLGYLGVIFYLYMSALASLLAFDPVVARLASGCAALWRTWRVRLDILHAHSIFFHPRLLRLLSDIRFA